ncbi:hypothetical protein GALL_199460 [mine drainage metagenome]|uniref:Uncharacterized protein n=1 Tax=mine drainage metagenome TaxID=410659 RepID=A0A1J5RQN2_9ZZZZ
MKTTTPPLLTKIYAADLALRILSAEEKLRALFEGFPKRMSQPGNA